MGEPKRTRSTLSPLESQVIQVLWELGAATAEQVRAARQPEQPLKESTVRTLLSRIEAKGLVDHETAGRTYVSVLAGA